MVMLRRWSVQWRENGLTEVVSLMERERSCYGGGQFNRGSMIVREVVSLMEGEWLCYGGGQFNGGGMVMLPRVTLMKGQWSSILIKQVIVCLFVCLFVCWFVCLSVRLWTAKLQGLTG